MASNEVSLNLKNKFLLQLGDWEFEVPMTELPPPDFPVRRPYPPPLWAERPWLHYFQRLTIPLPPPTDLITAPPHVPSAPEEPAEAITNSHKSSINKQDPYEQGEEFITELTTLYNFAVSEQAAALLLHDPPNHKAMIPVQVKDEPLDFAFDKHLDREFCPSSCIKTIDVSNENMSRWKYKVILSPNFFWFILSDMLDEPGSDRNTKVKSEPQDTCVSDTLFFCKYDTNAGNLCSLIPKITISSSSRCLPEAESSRFDYWGRYENLFFVILPFSNSLEGQSVVQTEKNSSSHVTNGSTSKDPRRQPGM